MKHLKNIIHYQQLVLDWEFVPIGETVRVYYKERSNEGDGFSFYVVEVVTSDGKEIWNAEKSGIELLYWGEAYSAGIVKIFQVGEMVYPNLSEMKQILIELEDLSKKFCTDYEHTIN